MIIMTGFLNCFPLTQRCEMLPSSCGPCQRLSKEQESVAVLAEGPTARLKQFTAV
jgi:hypothetical protein